MLSLVLSLLLGAEPPWEFHDSATRAGRTLVTYRPVELADTPVSPLAAADRPPGKARYGMLPIGSRPDAHPAIVWRADAPGGPEVWIDADGDGRFQAAERHKFDRPTLEVALHVHLGKGAEARRLPRTLLVRHRAVGDGLSYAVRGYVAGRLDLGGPAYEALLTDHNADGRFDTPGADRVWIDLDRDGSFDALTEQFALGTPVTVGSRTFLIQPRADGGVVKVRERPLARGTVRLALPLRPGVKVRAFSAQLVSDWGELVLVKSADEPVALPVGRYTIEALSCELSHGAGPVWSYGFFGEGRYHLEVTADRETICRPLAELSLASRRSPAGLIAPKGELRVTPSLRTPQGLELMYANFVAPDSAETTSASAAIELLASDGSIADRASSGFL
jgi:hypothetical protein